MAGPIPLLNFDFGNPMDTALKSAMAAYQGITAGQASKTQNQLNQAKLPYAEDMAKYEALIKSVDADYARKNAEAGYQKSVTDLDKAKAELQMYPQSQQAQINLANAQAAAQKSSADINKYKLNNPGFMGGTDSKNMAGMLAIIKQMEKEGLIKNPQNNNQSNFSQSPSSGQVYAEPAGGMNTQPTGRSYSQEEALDPNFTSTISNSLNEMEPNSESSFTGSGLPSNVFNPTKIENAEMDPYQNILSQIQNKLDRGAMQPWDVAAKSQRAKEDVTYFNKALVPIATEAKKAGDKNQMLRGMRETWERIPEIDRGKGLATMPAFPGAAQTFDTLYNQMVLDAMSLQKGTQGENDAKRLENAFASRKFTDDSMDETTTILELSNERAQEYFKFMAKKYEENVSESKAQTEWQDLVNKHSIFDSPQYLDYQIRSEERRKAREMGER